MIKKNQIRNDIYAVNGWHAPAYVCHTENYDSQLHWRKLSYLA